MDRTMQAVLAVCLGMTAGCDATQRAEMAEQTQKKAGELASAAGDKAGELASAAGDKTLEAARAAGDKTMEAARAARDWAGGLVTSGKLSETVEDWLRRGAAASGSGIEAVLKKGEQAVPVALDIGKALVNAVDSDTLIEPIYQEVGGDAPELELRRTEADEAIRGMTRVEVIDGLQVGFKQLSSLDLGHSVSEQAYLVVWRQDNRLIGFVYRSRRDIALQALVGAAPGIIGLVRSAL
jgi:hypothetical protein